MLFFCRILIVLIAILSAYSIHLLLKCAGVVGKRSVLKYTFTLVTDHVIFVWFWIELYNIIIPLFVILGIRAYEQLGYRAFGSAGKIIAACIITIHNIGGEIARIKHIYSNDIGIYSFHRMVLLFFLFVDLQPCPATFLL